MKLRLSTDHSSVSVTLGDAECEALFLRLGVELLKAKAGKQASEKEVKRAVDLLTKSTEGQTSEVMETATTGAVVADKGKGEYPAVASDKSGVGQGEYSAVTSNKSGAGQGEYTETKAESTLDGGHTNGVENATNDSHIATKPTKITAVSKAITNSSYENRKRFSAGIVAVYCKKCGKVNIIASKDLGDSCTCRGCSTVIDIIPDSLANVSFKCPFCHREGTQLTNTEETSLNTKCVCQEYVYLEWSNKKKAYVLPYS